MLRSGKTAVAAVLSWEETADKDVLWELGR